MNVLERIGAFHRRATEAGALGRLLFGVRLPLLYPLIMLLVLLGYLMLPGEGDHSVTVIPMAAPVAEVEVMPRVNASPPMPEPVIAEVAPAASASPPAAQAAPPPPPAVAGNGNAEWLLSLPPKGYTLQLLGSRHEETLREFVRRYRLESMTAYYRTRLTGEAWYVLLYGLYADRDEASVAVGMLPPAVRKNAPFPRTIESVQKAIREGR
ncbi:SPOR domain-containing protein [Endothiovibrio diazotrophicus]